jgi:hypothetical protein
MLTDPTKTTNREPLTLDPSPVGRGEESRGRECQVWSVSTRAGLLAAEGLTPTQKDLGHLLVLESYDRGAVRAVLDLEGWARRLRVRDARGPRPDKLRRVLEELVNCGVADVNTVENWVELRPHPEDWLEARLLRADNRGATAGAGSAVQPYLALRSERELAEAMSAVSREKATSVAATVPLPRDGKDNGVGEVSVGKPDLVQALFSTLKSELNANASTEEIDRKIAEEIAAAGLAASSAGKADVGEGGCGGKSRRTEVAGDGALGGVTAKAADPSIASLVLLKKLATSSGGEPSRSGGTRAGTGAGSAKDAEFTLRAVHALRAVDLTGELENPRVSRQWSPLLERNPGYVFEKLLPAYERAKKSGKKVENPVAYMAIIGVCEGKLERMKRVAR